MKQLTLFIFLLFVDLGFTQQNNINSVHNDTIWLHYNQLPNATIQWQYSYDSISWENSSTNFSYYELVNTNNLPVYYRASITEESCESYFSSILKIDRDMPTYYWSDPAAWISGQIPVADETVIIPADRRIILDINTPNLSGLVIEGILEFMNRDLNLTSDYIYVEGTLQIGFPNAPYVNKANIILTADDPLQDIMGMGTRGIMVMNGNLELHAATPTVLWTKISNHVNTGATSINLIQEAPWNIGDECIISPTDYYLAANGNSMTQKFTLAGVTATNLQSNEPINAFRWGLLQYATPEGLSLESNNIIDSPAEDLDTASTPKVLDERAYVGNLSRNIVIQSIEDDLWLTQGFGAHVMIMGTSSVVHLNGIEIRRGGQRARLGRYPIHWHMLSYQGTETLADATGHYFRNSVVNRSTNRGVVIHGTNGLLIKNNIIFDIEGHGVFTEDAVERRNTIDSNLVLKIRNPQVNPNLALKQHEVAERGSSGFWISNPDNIISNNVAGDCGTNGFWLSFPANPWGISSSVLAEDGLIMNPSRIRFGIFDNNTAFSNGLEGIMLDEVEIDNEGNTFPRQYASTTDGRDPVWPNTTLLRFYLTNYKVWKNRDNGIWDRAVRAVNYGVVSADNCGRFFAGAGDDGIIERSLVIGTSLNHLMNGTDRPIVADFQGTHSSSFPVAFATYHSTFDIKNNLVYEFPVGENTRSGVFSTDDYYTRAVEKGQIRNSNNVIINSHSGVKLASPYTYFTLASAVWDPYGIWGPANNYFVYDDVFLTYNKPITLVQPSTFLSGGVSVPGPFYGFEGFVLHGVGNTPPQNQPYMDLMGIHVRRLDQDLNEVATWTVTTAQPAYFLQHMRDFATTPEGIYDLTFPDETVLPTNFQVNVENMLTTNDVQVIAIQFDCTLNPIVTFNSPGNYRIYSEVNSIQDVLNSNGETWFKDTINNRVWVKLQGGHWEFWTDNPAIALPSFDDELYNTSVLRIYQP